MTYSIKQVSDMAGISTRTLRHYDQIGLLAPSGYSRSGYRQYNNQALDRLQQILFYRTLKVSLGDIKAILDDPGFDIVKALEHHQKMLLEEKETVDQLLKTVEKTIQNMRGNIEMNAEEKFEGFKQSKFEENERVYGEEIRAQYGEDTVEASNKKFMNLSEADFKEMEEIENELFKSLVHLYETKDLTSDTAYDVYSLHKKWLMYTWTDYSKVAHKGLVEMYLADERFSQYYNNRAGKEVVTLLYGAVIKYTSEAENE